jgi:two-component system, chemotaxis family, protein-glutamate methylesterase/glutaminase
VSGSKRRYDLIAMGASAGGLTAVSTILARLPADFAIAIAVVQHRAKQSELLAALLQDSTKLKVVEVEDKQPIGPGYVYVAPPDYHLLIDQGTFALSTDDLVLFSRPSIDVFFDSAADAYGPGTVGIVLTGANSDGSKGLKKIVERGGQAFVQDPATAEVNVMPAAAHALVPRARIASLEGIADHLLRMNEVQLRQVAAPS